jgi:hypothetical protein
MALLELPQGLREVLSRDPAKMTCSPMFASSLAYVRAGFSVVPCVPDSKRPRTTEHFRRGGHSATGSFEVIREHWYAHPDDNVGLASDGSIVFLDIDPRNGGSLEAAARLGLPVNGYREQTAGGGHHIPLVMPNGTRGERSATIAPGIEIKGVGSYVVSAHSVIRGSWYRPEAERDIWAFGAIPERWEHLERIIGRPNDASNEAVVTLDDMESAKRVVKRLLASTEFAPMIKSVLFGGGHGRYRSRSEADAALALMATHFLRGHNRRREILTALLQRHSLKAASHKNPSAYITCVVRAAESERDAREAARLAYFVECFVGDDVGDTYSRDCDMGVVDDITTIPPVTPVYDPKLLKHLSRRSRARKIERSILSFATWPDIDEYTMDDDWRRFPVELAAQTFEVTPEAIRLRLKALEERGLIERWIVTRRHDERPRRDSLVRPGRPVDY